MNHSLPPVSKAEPNYDYSNQGRPRDFDIRFEVAEQQEIIDQYQPQTGSSIWHCSEYDF